MKKTTFLIAGTHAVVEALKNPKRKVHRIFATEDSRKRINKNNQNLNLLKNVHVFYKSKKELDNLIGQDEISHQGLIAEIEPLDEVTLKDFLKNDQNENLNFIALEDVTDPRNIGAIIRSAVAFNIHGLIVKERSFPFKSKVMYKSASGGVESLNIFKVSNISTAIKFLKSKKFWVSAFDSKSKSDFTNHDWRGRNVLLFGSEGVGLKLKTLENSDFRFKININSKIESLNISNSVAVVCHYIKTKTN
tara:strand:- start:506 stop:1249 length:744 start_codon:yes stop_codon:yes gene_type:complete